jgi:hypothetical protein
VFNITAGGDAITAATTVSIANGQFNLTTGGGSRITPAADASSKGVKGLISTIISGGTFTADCADDAIHANASIFIKGGSFTIATGDDALHADASLEVSGGEINIIKSYEGLESKALTLSGGTCHVVSSDDGINGADPNAIGGQGGNSAWLYLRGSYVVVNAAGDGIDINGSAEMTSGTVIVHGPTASMNAAVDYNGTFKMTGGLLVAAGSSGMAQAPGTSSTQNVLLANFTARTAGTLVSIQNSSGQGILTFAPAKTYQSIAFSSPELLRGSTYNIYFGGSATGTVSDGLYQNGTYTGGTQYTSFTVSSVVTTLR